MKSITNLITFILFIITLNLTAQKVDQPIDSLSKVDRSGTYLGITGTPNYLGVSITSEIELKFLVMSLQTNLNNYDPTFKGRLGFQAGNEKFKAVLFMPMFNLSLEEFSYNTPPSVEFRYKPTVIGTNFLIALGTEFYKKDYTPYLTVSIKFE